MEVVQGTDKATRFASEDVISRMPEDVISNILNRLSIKDAIRTSILATNWRFKWTLLTHLVFDDDFFDRYTPRSQGHKYYYVKNISRLLLHLKGDITKFFIAIPVTEMLDDEDISHWILFLSTKRIKDFTLLVFGYGGPVRLPTHLLSCPELTHLKLYDCCFPPMHTFRGFPNLLSLNFGGVQFESCKDWEFIARCPLLETLNIVCKTSSLFWFIASLQTLTELTIHFFNCKFLEEAGDRKRVPIVMHCLKTLTLWQVDFCSDVMVSSVFDMICGSPNLRTLEILGIIYNNAGPPPAFYSSEVDCSCIGQLQLVNVMIEPIKGSERELCFIKFLLARSPWLKKMKIRLLEDTNENFRFSSKLLKFRRASPIVEIDLGLDTDE